MRTKFDRFTSASFRQGSTVGSISAYLGAESPTEMLDRASLLNVLGAEHLDVLDTMRRAVERKTTLERTARTALRRAVANRNDAAKAKQAAERAYTAAEEAQNAAKAETERLADERAALASQAGSTVSGGGQTGTGGVVLPAQGTLTSTYGARWGTIHYGIDIANEIGTPIVSAMAGEVIDSGPASGFGLWVRVQHSNGLITVYGHINESLVSVGQQVSAGQQIATIGNRGQSTGPHLHFEVHQDGSKIDPLIWLRSHGIDI
ncbi:hypothetical protein BAY60_07460 [Prauserella muralis]|uniref:M23ase beta-sheet core domain-containing protein n=1 Tax=Prauserella muralis TaxID=588067 RepID=A0A2V4BCA4_9PSEU|nr:hypothetical protein BAY60_07460 [Prauserella muralis]